jgi:hypothetical protein
MVLEVFDHSMFLYFGVFYSMNTVTDVFAFYVLTGSQQCNLQVNEFQQNPENAVVMMMMMIRRDAVSPEFLDIADGIFLRCLGMPRIDYSS